MLWGDRGVALLVLDEARQAGVVRKEKLVPYSL